MTTTNLSGELTRLYRETMVEEVVRTLDELGIREMVQDRLAESGSVNEKPAPARKAMKAASPNGKPKWVNAEDKTCTWKGCSEPMFWNMGLCKIHYNHKREGSDMNAPIKRRAFNGRTPAHAKSEKKAAAPKADDGKKHDNPQPLGRMFLGDEASRHRRLDCPVAQRCAVIARRAQWKAYTCAQCKGPKASAS